MTDDVRLPSASSMASVSACAPSSAVAIPSAVLNVPVSVERTGEYQSVQRVTFRLDHTEIHAVARLEGKGYLAHAVVEGVVCTAFVGFAMAGWFCCAVASVVAARVPPAALYG